MQNHEVTLRRALGPWSAASIVIWSSSNQIDISCMEKNQRADNRQAVLPQY